MTDPVATDNLMALMKKSRSDEVMFFLVADKWHIQLNHHSVSPRGTLRGTFIEISFILWSVN
jgi:hypothetical protein